MSTTETPEASAIADRAKKLRGPRRARTELTPEQQALVTDYVPLALSAARAMKAEWRNYRDDINSTALLALVEAAQVFEPARGVKFSTFARIRIRGALGDVQRTFGNKHFDPVVPEAGRPFRYVPGEEDQKMLMLASGDPEVGTELESVDQVEHWFRAIPARNAEVCHEIYLKDRNQADAAKALRRAKSRINHLHAESLDLLRQSGNVREAALAIGLHVDRN